MILMSKAAEMSLPLTIATSSRTIHEPFLISKQPQHRTLVKELLGLVSRWKLSHMRSAKITSIMMSVLKALMDISETFNRTSPERVSHGVPLRD